ncbi:MFS transporter [Halomarina salina]|uniref:MFS transporter n=1 Tax=Halomarina salina TaxID=1872699 RepID=A0ABD5RIE5_9EURY
MSSLRRLVGRFYAYRALSASGFVMPVLTLYLLAQDVSLAGVGLAGGAFFAGTLLAEIPTGYVGDRVGRRNSLLLGSLVVATAHAGFALSSSLPAFVASWGLWGVGSTFRTGSADAWLYDSLAEADATDAFTRVRGRGFSAYLVTAGVTALAGGVLYEVGHSLPFVAAAVTSLLSGLVVLTLPEPAVTAESDRFTLAEARDALGTIAGSRSLRRFVLVVAVVRAVPETAEVFVQPVATAAGLRPAALGPLYCVLMLVAAVGSAAAERTERLGVARWFAVGPLFLAATFALGAVVPAVALPAFAVSRGVDALTSTLASSELNDRIVSRGRATTLSAASLVYSLAFMTARFLGGSLADRTTPLVALTLFGFGAVAVVAVVGALGDPFRTESAETARAD